MSMKQKKSETAFADKIPSPTTSIVDYLKCLQSSKASIFFNPTDVLEIKRIVTMLPSKKSSGHDNISNILLKEIVDSIAHILCTILINPWNKENFLPS